MPDMRTTTLLTTPTQKATMVVTVVLITAAIGAAPAAAQQAEPQTIAAAGVGRAFLVPDQAQVFVSADRLRPTSRAARAAVNRIIAAARRAVLRHGIDPQAIQTSGVSVSRERRRTRRGGPVRIRFRASSQLTVLSRDVPGLGKLIDAVADTGADVFGPEFSFTDPSQGDILATRAALADARRRADDAAAQLGMRVTGIQSVDLEPSLDIGFGRSDDSGAGGGVEEGSTRIEPGLERFVAVVKVVYTVGPA
jgi:uncharacterized protein YggE